MPRSESHFQISFLSLMTLDSCPSQPLISFPIWNQVMVDLGLSLNVWSGDSMPLMTIRTLSTPQRTKGVDKSHMVRECMGCLGGFMVSDWQRIHSLLEASHPRPWVNRQETTATSQILSKSHLFQLWGVTREVTGGGSNWPDNAWAPLKRRKGAQGLIVRQRVASDYVYQPVT